MTGECDIGGCTRPAIWATIGEAGDLYFCSWHTTTYVQHAWQRAERAENRSRQLAEDFAILREAHDEDESRLTEAVRLLRATLYDPFIPVGRILAFLDQADE